MRRFDLAGGMVLTGTSRRTDGGALLVVGRAARTGVQDYGDHLEHRDASEVFAPEHLATWKGLPLTVGHRGWVDRANVHSWSVGYVRDVRRVADGEHDWIEADIIVTHEPTARAILDGTLVELSAGYAVELVDGRQTQLRANHLAAGPKDWARAGREARIH
jgi:uncharacterized protein